MKILLALLAIMMCGCGHSKGTEITVAVPDLPVIDIQNPERFLNDLMLSPFWYVVKDGNAFVAHARTLRFENLASFGDVKNSPSSSTSCNASTPSSKPTAWKKIVPISIKPFLKSR